jgi:hypothetical protein
MKMYWVGNILHPPIHYVLQGCASLIVLVLLINPAAAQLDDVAFNSSQSLDYQNTTKGVRARIPEPADPCKAGKCI